MEVIIRPDANLEVSGVFGESVPVSDRDLVPRYEYRNTKPPELAFHALLESDGARGVRFERVPAGYS